MRVLVNGLSVGSLSGEHVLYGHLEQLSRWTTGRHEFVVLHQPGKQPKDRQFSENVTFQSAPSLTSKWYLRSAWESFKLPKLMKQLSVDAYFSPSGTVLPRSHVPQFSLAQNPWSLVDAVPKTGIEKVKVKLQHSSYRRALKQAETLFFNSRYMQSAYHQLIPSPDKPIGKLCYQGIDDDVHVAGKKSDHIAERIPFSIVSVSAMAPWKGADILVKAVALLRERDIPATAKLVGPWPNADYRTLVERLIVEKKLQDAVSITGKVSREELWQNYASAKVFCLMSQCESFGIPAVEAQAFGTPVVGADVCAMPEIGGDGGVFGTPTDEVSTANLLEGMLTDESSWQTYSDSARENVGRFQWSVCSRPLLEIVGESYSQDEHQKHNDGGSTAEEFLTVESANN